MGCQEGVYLSLMLIRSPLEILEASSDSLQEMAYRHLIPLTL